MAVLWMDSFDNYATADLNMKYQHFVGAGAHDITASQGRGATATQALRLRQGSGGNNGLRRDLPAGQTTLYAGMSIKPTVFTNAGTNPSGFLCFHNKITGVCHIMFCITPTGLVQAIRGLATGTVLATSSQAMVIGQTHHWEFKVVLHATTGIAEVRRDGVVVATFTGNTINSGAGTMDAVSIGDISNANAGFDAYFDDYWIDDAAYNGDLRVGVILPTGAGNTTGLTPSSGSNYAVVNEALQNGDTGYVSSSTVSAKDTYAYADLPANAATVKAVMAAPIARKEDAGARYVCAVARSGGADYDGSALSLGTTYEAQAQIWNTNPATSAAWTVAEVNAAEFGVKVYS